MKLPKLPYNLPKGKTEIVAMRGINYSDQIKDGDFAAMENMSGRRFPYLTQRRKRSRVDGYDNPQSVFAWDHLVVVDGTDLKVDGVRVGTVTAGEKQFAVVNTKLVVWPDEVYVDLTNNKFVQMNAQVQSGAGTSVTFTTNAITMTGSYKTVTQQFTSCYDHESRFGDGYLTKRFTSVAWDSSKGWTLTGEEETEIRRLSNGSSGCPKLVAGDIVLFKASSVSGNYALNTRQYTRYLGDNDRVVYDSEYGDYMGGGYYGVVSKISETYDDNDLFNYTTVIFTVMNTVNDALDLSSQLKAGDQVQVSGCTSIKANNTASDTHLVINSVTADTITFEGTPFTAGTEAGQVKVQRSMPDMDYICASENRLWGVSNKEKTIYASALGDPASFYIFEGVSTDSYAVAVGSDGDFTAIGSYNGSVHCWKEHLLHKVLGSYPSEYAVYTYQYDGVQEGCSKSLLNINETIYFLGRNGVYAYSGGAPQLISDIFGEHRYTNGRAGADGFKLYLSCQEGEVWNLFTYDTRTGLWMREDATQALSFATLDGVTYMVDGGNKRLMRLNDDAADETIRWTAQFAPFYETIQGRKQYSRVLLRFEIAKGAGVEVYIRRDGGAWKMAGRILGADANTKALPVLPGRCDKFEILLTGYGDCTVLSVMREFRVGSNV